jgi:hypothetical protein
LKKCILILLLFFSGLLLLAEDQAQLLADLTREVLPLMGVFPSQLLEQKDAPQEVYSIRNSQAEFDNVVFFYNDFSYFYFYKNRVWQIRLDNRFTGIEFGQQIDDFLKIYGEPFSEDSDENDGREYRSLYYQWFEGNNSWAYRIRLIFVDGVLQDFYLYRGDF